MVMIGSLKISNNIVVAHALIEKLFIVIVSNNSTRKIAKKNTATFK